MNREPILSNIIVGDGSAVPTGSTHAVPNITLSPLGQIVEKHIHMIPTKYLNTKIDSYVIMPDHIHMVLSIQKGRANPAPTPIGNIVGWFKYATTKMMANYWNTPDNRFWQRSYHDHIIRNEQDYLKICQYINENPMHWLQKQHSSH